MRRIVSFRFDGVIRTPKDKPSNGNEATIGAMLGCAWGMASATGLQPWADPGYRLEHGYSFVLIVALALSGKHRALSTFRGHIQGRTIVSEVAAIFATAWLPKQFGSPHFT